MQIALASEFFSYLNEREQIRRRKLADLPYPWTEDPILGTYKFTNVNRHHDRTSNELRDMYYEKHFNAPRIDILMNCALYRYFGTYEFARVVGWHSHKDFPFAQIEDLAQSRLEEGKRVFTGAYVITNQGISAPKSEVVVNYFLKDLHENAEELVDIAEFSRSWKDVATEMMKINGFGGSGFMTKEILLDTTYTGFWGEENFVYDENEGGNFSFPSDWKTWTPIGPGARRGASRVIGGDYKKPLTADHSREVINELVTLSRKGYSGSTQLVPTDIQFALCEFDKYQRVLHGEGKPRSKYKGPK